MGELCVIMSIYKNDIKDHVEIAIKSVLTQSYHKYDLYIKIDGYINLETEKYIDSLTDERIFVRKRISNCGLAISLNELLEEVLTKDYEFIARMDADDICAINRFERQITYLYKYKDVDCLGSWAIEIDNDGNEYFEKKMPERHEECIKLFEKRDFLIHPSVIFRTKYFEKAGLYPTDTYFAEDTIMWANGVQSGCTFANVQENLIYFRLDNDFFSRRRGLKHAISILKVRKRVIRQLRFGYKSYLYAYLYAFMKLMPESIINICYKTFR